MADRDVILQRLRESARDVAMPGPWTTRRAFEDPIARFCESLIGLKGEVQVADSLEAAWRIVDGLLDAIDAVQVVVNQEPPVDAMDVASRWPDRSSHIVGASEGDLRSFCANADVGLSGVSAALVETGSLIVESGAGRSRLATLLPPVHIAMLPTSRLTTDLFTWCAERNGDIATNVTVISGPSKTADIEFTLTLGAHGPKRLIAVVYRDGQSP
jgi:L-lactate dehydrogenase complex protein LldG